MLKEGDLVRILRQPPGQPPGLLGMVCIVLEVRARTSGASVGPGQRVAAVERMALVRGINSDGSVAGEGAVPTSCLLLENGEEWQAAFEKHKALLIELEARHRAKSVLWDAKLGEVAVKHGLGKEVLEAIWKELVREADLIERVS